MHRPPPVRGKTSNCRELATLLIGIVAEIEDAIGKAQTLVGAARTVGLAGRMIVHSRNRSLAASRDYIDFCRLHRGDHSSHEWYQHIGRLGGCWRKTYDYQKRSAEQAASVLDTSSTAKKLFNQHWPRIQQIERRMLAASRRKAVSPHDSLVHDLMRDLHVAYVNLHKALPSA